MKIYLIMFMSLLCFQACNNSGTRNTLVSLSTDTLTLNNTPTIFKGLYTFGNEVNTFRNCDTAGKIYWVNDSLTDMRKGYETSREFLSYPYESVYAEVKGYLSGKSEVGYASEYENVLVITELIKIEPKNYKTACYNYEFVGLGNEPFWSLDIIPNEKRIIFKNAGIEKVSEFMYSPADKGQDVYRYDVTNPKQGKLVIIIRRGKCSDGMSDRQYNYSAEITLNGTLYKGCAIKKGD